MEACDSPVSRWSLPAARLFSSAAATLEPRLAIRLGT